MGRVPRTADNIKIPLKAEDAILAFMRVKPTASMPRPGKHRSKSIVKEMDEEYGPLQPKRKPSK